MKKKYVVDEQKTFKLVLTIVGNVVFYAVIIVLFLFSLMNINAGNGKQNFPNLFGKGMLSVQSDSMEREDGYHPEYWNDYDIQEIKTGDLVFVKVYKEGVVLSVGDVITFYDPTVDKLITHRIVQINEKSVLCEGDKIVTKVSDDSYAYDIYNSKSQKNAELSMRKDGSGYDYIQTVSKEQIKGVVTSVSPGKGKVLDTLRDKWLFFFVIPVAIVLLIEVFFVFKNILDLKAEKNQASLEDNKEAMMKELEAEKERMRQELLAELRAQEAKTSEDVVEGEVSEPVEKEE